MTTSTIMLVEDKLTAQPSSPTPEGRTPTKKERNDIIGLFEFMQMFPDEAAAVVFIEREIWGQHPRCGRCGSNSVYATTNGRPMSHRCRRCRRHFSVRTGTTMAQTNLPLRSWLLAIHLMLTGKKGISALQLHKELGVAYQTAWFLEHRIREAMNETKRIMSGIVEIDETYFGGKWNRMHADKKPPKGTAWKDTKFAVVGLRQANTGKVIAFPVPDTFAETLQKAVTDNVKPGSIIYSDGEPAYQDLPWLGYMHEYVVHSQGEYVRDGVTTNGIEGFWRYAKHIVYQYRGVSKYHFPMYLKEIEYRFNHRQANVFKQFLKIYFGYVSP